MFELSLRVDGDVVWVFEGVLFMVVLGLFFVVGVDVEGCFCGFFCGMG